MTRRRYIERGEEFGEWSLLVKGDDVLAIRSIPHQGQRYYSTEDRANRPDKNSEFGLDIEEVVKRYAAYSDTETPLPELLEDVSCAFSAAGPGSEEP